MNAATVGVIIGCGPIVILGWGLWEELGGIIRATFKPREITYRWDVTAPAAPVPAPPAKASARTWGVFAVIR